MSAIREWFRTYKVPDGKPENVFGLEERCMDAEYAFHIVEETHEAWKHLVVGKKEGEGGRNLFFPTMSEQQVVISSNGTLKKNLSSGRLSSLEMEALVGAV